MRTAWMMVGHVTVYYMYARISSVCYKTLLNLNIVSSCPFEEFTCERNFAHVYRVLLFTPFNTVMCNHQRAIIDLFNEEFIVSSSTPKKALGPGGAGSRRHAANAHPRAKQITAHE